MPPRMMGLRPIRSESPPRITKNGVASSSAMPTMMLEVTTSSFWTVCRKNSAQNWLLYQTTPCPITTTAAISTYLTF